MHGSRITKPVGLDPNHRPALHTWTPSWSAKLVCPRRPARRRQPARAGQRSGRSPRQPGALTSPREKLPRRVSRPLAPRSKATERRSLEAHFSEVLLPRTTVGVFPRRPTTASRRPLRTGSIGAALRYPSCAGRAGECHRGQGLDADERQSPAATHGNAEGVKPFLEKRPPKVRVAERVTPSRVAGLRQRSAKAQLAGYIRWLEWDLGVRFGGLRRARALAGSGSGSVPGIDMPFLPGAGERAVRVRAGRHENALAGAASRAPGSTALSTLPRLRRRGRGDCAAVLDGWSRTAPCVRRRSESRSPTHAGRPEHRHRWRLALVRSLGAIVRGRRPVQCHMTVAAIEPLGEDGGTLVGLQVESSADRAASRCLTSV